MNRCKSSAVLVSVIWAMLLIATNELMAQTEERADFRILLHAVDETGQPVPAADIGFGWGIMDGPKPDSGHERRTADLHGIALFEGRTKFPRFVYGARCEGFYPSQGFESQHTRQDAGRWERWGLTIPVVLRAIRNPVPMYARVVQGSLPAKEIWVGYDLERGQWVTPYGQGQRSDFEFRYEGSVESNKNYDGRLALRFPGPGNGILAHEQDPSMRSEFRMPYEAPEEGYVNTWAWRNACITEKKPGAVSKYIDESFVGRNFIFRVRSVLDEHGKVIRASYGTIRGPFIFDPRGDNANGHVKFTYYFNPDQTRNLEFDPKRNLFRDQNITAP